MRKTDADRILDLRRQAQEFLDKAKELEDKELKRIAEANQQRYQNQGEHLDGVLPELSDLTMLQFKTFISKTLLTPFAKRELAAVQAPQQPPENQNQKGAATHGNDKERANDPSSTGNPATQKQGESDAATAQRAGT